MPKDHNDKRSGTGARLGAFVGRVREMGILHQALELAQSGNGGIIMISGEAGAGKTRTATEFGRICADGGALVLTGRCLEGDAVPPLYPWITCVRGYLESHGTEDMPGFADLARWWDHGSRHAQDPAAASTLPDKYHLFDAVAEAFRRASGDEPIVLVLDNLHCADRASLELLEFLAPTVADSRLLIIGTYPHTEIKQAHPLFVTLGILTTEPRFQRIQLQGLREKDVAKLAEVMLGGSAASALVREVCERTDGNALFVTEVLRNLAAEGYDPEDDSTGTPDIGIPEGARQAIGRRLERMSKETVAALGVAAVVGRSFTVDVLARAVAGGDRTDVFRRLEEGMGADLIEEIPGATGEFRFTHALVRDALLHEMISLRRVGHHASIARVLEELAAEGRPITAEALFHHFAEAAGELGTEGMARHGLRAAEQALETYAYDDALTAVDRAIGVMHRHPSEARETNLQLANLLFCRGRIVQMVQRRFEDAKTALHQAFDAFVALGEIKQAVEVALFPMFAGGESLPDLRLRSLDLVEKESIEEARLLCEQARDFAVSGSLEPVPFQHVQALARMHGDEALEVRALCFMGSAKVSHGRVEEGMRDLDTALERSSALADPAAHAYSSFLTHCAHLTRGQPEEASRVLRSMTQAFESGPGYGPYLWIVDHSRAVLHLYKGEFDEAVRSCRVGASRADRRLTRGAGLAGLRAFIEAQTARDVAAARDLAIDWAHWDRPNLRFMAVRLCRLFEYEECIDRTRESMTAIVSATDEPPSEVLIARFTLALIACLRDDKAAAGTLYPHLRPSGGAMRPGVMSAICVDRLLGLLCTTTGELDQALSHFDAATAFCEQAGYLPDLAWTCYDHAGALLRRGASGDRGSARVKLETGLALVRKLGMRPLEGLMLERLGETEGPRARPDGLTPREIEVLELVVRGLTNAEIGEKLFISPHTCATHVQHILSKTGMANRAELTAHALRNHLVE